MQYETILLEKKDHVAKLTLNRPDVLNAINKQMFADLNAGLQDVADDPDSWVLVLTGAGRAFCASADIKEERQGDGDRFAPHPTTYGSFEFIRANPQQITLKIHQMRKPTIAMVNGLAVGDGFDWVLACDIRIGSEKARFMNAFLQMGLVSNTGGTWLYPRTMGLNKAFELLYTGDWLSGEDAHAMGILNRLVSAESLDDETMALARKIASKAPIANKLVKEMVYQGLGQNLEEHLLSAAYAEAFTITTEDHREALAAFLEKRDANFKGE